MFVVWFISGIVLIFDGFPHASREQRFFHLSEFTPQQFENLQAPPKSFKGNLALEICDGKAVYRVRSGRKAQQTYDAKSLQLIGSFDEEYAKSLSESFNGYSLKELKKISKLDDWVPWSYYRPLLPIYKCYMDDPGHSVLYISSKTGEIVQETNRRARWSARVGAIPHWIYFKRLRLVKDTWKLVVIILSSFGVLLCISGIYAGFVRMNSRKKKGITPYKKFWYKWHHLTGFFFGLFVFTFILSGLFSLASVPDWVLGVDPEKKIEIEWNQNLDLSNCEDISPSDIYSAIDNKKGIRKIEWKTVFNKAQFRVYYSHYQKADIYTLQDGKIVPQKDFTLEDIQAEAKNILGNNSFSVSKQNGYDNYYSGSTMYYLPEQAFKIEVDDAARTHLYINPANGDRVKKLTKNTRVRRWLYRFLHTLDLPILKKVDWLRKTLLVLLSLLGLSVSITGFVISLKWFKRNFRRRKLH